MDLFGAPGATTPLVEDQRGDAQTLPGFDFLAKLGQRGTPVGQGVDEDGCIEVNHEPARRARFRLLARRAARTSSTSAWLSWAVRARIAGARRSKASSRRCRSSSV